MIFSGRYSLASASGSDELVSRETFMLRCTNRFQGSVFHVKPCLRIANTARLAFLRYDRVRPRKTALYGSS